MSEETAKAMLSYFDKFLASFHTLTETVKDMRSGARNSTQTLEKYKGERGRMQHFVLGYRAMPRKWRCNLTTFQWFNHCNFANYSACHEKWHCNFTNIVPASKSSTPASLQLHQICACCERSHCSFIKFSPCHKKLHPNITATSPSWFAHHEQWHSCLVRIKHETSRSMRWASRVTLQHVHVQRIVQVQDLIAKSVNCFRHKEDESNLPGHNPRTIWGGSAQRAYLSFKRSKRLHWKLNLEIIYKDFSP